MTNLNIEKLIKLLKEDRKRILTILLEIFEKVNGRLKVPNELLKEIFLENTYIKTNGEKHDITKLRCDDLTMQLYKYFDFSKFTYSNLCVIYNTNNPNNNQTTLQIMRDNNIIFYTDKIYNKDCNSAIFKGIIIQGNFDNWKIENTDFENCFGNPIIHPECLLDKSLYGVKLADTYISGNCDDVLVESASFKGAHIDKDNFRFTPQKVKKASLRNSILSGVPINGNLDDVYVCNTNFTDYVGNVVFNCDAWTLEELLGNTFAGVYFSGSFDKKVKLKRNNFTESLNLIIDCSTINTRESRDNIFTDVTFRNLSKSSTYFCNMQRQLLELKEYTNNIFTNSIISYDALNKKDELKYYEDICKKSRYIEKTGLKDVMLENEDFELEEEIKSIIIPEIESQKKFKKTKKDS